MLTRDFQSFGNRLKACSDCHAADYEVDCGHTWHHCENGHYENVRSLPIKGECPEDKVPGEALETAKKLTEEKSVPETVELVEVENG